MIEVKLAISNIFICICFLYSCAISNVEECLKNESRYDYRVKYENFESYLLEEKFLIDNSSKSIDLLLLMLKDENDLVRFIEYISVYNKEPFGPSDFALLEGCCRDQNPKGALIQVCSEVLNISENGITLEGIEKYANSLSKKQYQNIYFKGMIYCMLFYLGP